MAAYLTKLTQPFSVLVSEANTHLTRALGKMGAAISSKDEEFDLYYSLQSAMYPKKDITRDQLIQDLIIRQIDALICYAGSQHTDDIDFDAHSILQQGVFTGYASMCLEHLIENNNTGGHCRVTVKRNGTPPNSPRARGVPLKDMYFNTNATSEALDKLEFTSFFRHTFGLSSPDTSIFKSLTPRVYFNKMCTSTVWRMVYAEAWRLMKQTTKCEEDRLVRRVLKEIQRNAVIRYSLAKRGLRGLSINSKDNLFYTFGEGIASPSNALGFPKLMSEHLKHRLDGPQKWAGLPVWKGKDNHWVHPAITNHPLTNKGLGNLLYLFTRSVTWSNPMSASGENHSLSLLTAVVMGILPHRNKYVFPGSQEQDYHHHIRALQEFAIGVGKYIDPSIKPEEQYSKFTNAVVWEQRDLDNALSVENFLANEIRILVGSEKASSGLMWRLINHYGENLLDREVLEACPPVKVWLPSGLMDKEIKGLNASSIPYTKSIFFQVRKSPRSEATHNFLQGMITSSLTNDESRGSILNFLRTTKAFAENFSALVEGFTLLLEQKRIFFFNKEWLSPAFTAEGIEKQIQQLSKENDAPSFRLYPQTVDIYKPIKNVPPLLIRLLLVDLPLRNLLGDFNRPEGGALCNMGWDGENTQQVLDFYGRDEMLHELITRLGGLHRGKFRALGYSDIVKQWKNSGKTGEVSNIYYNSYLSSYLKILSLYLAHNQAISSSIQRVYEAPVTIFTRFSADEVPRSIKHVIAEVTRSPFAQELDAVFYREDSGLQVSTYLPLLGLGPTPTTPEDMSSFFYLTNLITSYAANSLTSEEKGWKLVRDGGRLAPPLSRILTTLPHALSTVRKLRGNEND
jgi:hypothetical protein